MQLPKLRRYNAYHKYYDFGGDLMNIKTKLDSILKYFDIQISLSNPNVAPEKYRWVAIKTCLDLPQDVIKIICLFAQSFFIKTCLDLTHSSNSDIKYLLDIA